MKVAIVAVGRLRRGPEQALVADYLARFDALGRGLALGPARVVEVEDRRGRDGEAEALLAAAPEGIVVALDERGRMLDSPGFAAQLGRWRDAGHRHTSLLIGGADGHGGAVAARADLLLSLGPMVWPHLLVRVMLAEQLYRAASILSGAPYHRP